MKVKILFMFSLFVALIGGFNTTGYPQEREYPNKPIQLICAHRAGGVNDIFLRMLADELTKFWKVPVTVMNQTQAMGATAANAVSHAKKDGYTFLAIVVGTIGSMTAAKPDGPINLLRDFDPVFVDAGFASSLLVVRSDSKFKKLKDLISYAREKPGELICGTNTRGTEGYLEWELLKRVAKIDVTTLVLSGSQEVYPQLLGGHIDIGTAADSTVAPHVKAGKMRVLVVDTKSQLLPDVPTYAEEGYPEVKLLFSFCLLGPKDLPPTVLKAWNSALEVILKDPKFLAALKKIGINTNFEINSEKIRDFFKGEIEKYKQFTPQELGWE